jgi:hypothetical protein
MVGTRFAAAGERSPGIWYYLWYYRGVKRAALRRRIAQRPNAVRYEELAQLLRAYGFEERRSRRGTSHHYWVRGGVQLSIPYRRPHVLSVYVREALAATEGEDDSTGDGDDANDDGGSNDGG